MRRIRKGQEPKSWAEYRLSTPGANYQSAPKDEVRRALLREQGYVCCYCMGRIDEATTRIEHCRPRNPALEDQAGDGRRPSSYPHELDYRNMLAACPGGEGLEHELQHCDVRKRNDRISIDPASPSRNVESLVHYSATGAIDSTDPDVRRDLTVTLNLNLHWLKTARLEVLEGFRIGFERRHPKSWSAESMERELKRWASIPPGGKLSPYAGIVVHYLRKRLRRAAAGG